MKIICVGRNYVKHIKELNNEFPKQPIIFTKPDTSILLNNKDFYFPDFSSNVQFEVELLIKISKEGKKIPVSFANRYYNKVGIGICWGEKFSKFANCPVPALQTIPSK